MNSERILDISWGTIWKIFVAAVIIYILYEIRNVLIWFLFALVISILFNPAVNFLRKLKIPRVLAVCFIYAAFFGLLVLIAYATIPLFVSEIKQFSQVLPQYFEKFSPPLRGLGIKAFEDLDTFVGTLQGTLEKTTANVFNVLFATFGGIFATIFIISLSIYLSLEEKGVERALILFFPKKYETYALALWEKCEKKVGGWFLTRVLACLFIGLTSFFAFLLFNTPYSFTLAVLAGILNFIPIVGPLITGILLFITVALESLPKAILILIVYILIQQVENNILTPFISKKIIGLSPALVLMALVIGGILWGFLGAILAVPLAGILFEFLKEFLEKRKSERIAAS
jgi:predicted PurR-regulated permease PerM